MRSGTPTAGRPPATDRRQPTPPHGALTLVELLVVIVLISTLVATAIPVISPRGDERKLREASRNVNAYLQGAQARAVQTGRPFGVAIRRLSADTERGEQNAVGVRLEYVEVPPTFSGFGPTSAARLAVSPRYVPSPPIGDSNTAGLDDAPLWLQFVARGPTVAGSGLPLGWAGDLTPPRFLRPGDVIEVGGRRYEMLSAGTGNRVLGLPPGVDDATGYYPPSTVLPAELLTVAVRPVESREAIPSQSLPELNLVHDTQGQEITSPEALRRLNPAAAAGGVFWTEPQSYRVFRRPIPAGGEPMEMPSGIAIDLQASVVGGPTIQQLYNPANDFDESNQVYSLLREPIMILFAPEGHVQRVYGVGAFVDRASGLPVIPPPAPLSAFMALCVGRVELIPAQPWADSPTPATLAEPIDTTLEALTDLPEPERTEITDIYNWLNLESRWVVISGQTGAIATVENASAAPAETTREQLFSSLENARNRTKIGGR